MSVNPWNSLEIAKLIVGILTPIAVIGIGWFVNRRLKQLEHIQWANQKIIEKRLVLYDELAPLLNSLFCFFTWVGYWKDVSPKQVIEIKRKLDKNVNIYRHLLGDAFYHEYNEYINLLFLTYTGIGHDARILSFISGPDGNRKEHSNYTWKKEWDSLFIYKGLDYTKQKGVIKKQYKKLMQEFKDSIGVQ